jgi:hypothetical protein
VSGKEIEYSPFGSSNATNPWGTTPAGASALAELSLPEVLSVNELLSVKSELVLNELAAAVFVPDESTITNATVPATSNKTVTTVTMIHGLERGGGVGGPGNGVVVGPNGGGEVQVCWPGGAQVVGGVAPVGLGREGSCSCSGGYQSPSEACTHPQYGCWLIGSSRSRSRASLNGAAVFGGT